MTDDWTPDPRTLEWVARWLRTDGLDEAANAVQAEADIRKPAQEATR